MRINCYSFRVFFYVTYYLFFFLFSSLFNSEYFLLIYIPVLICHWIHNLLTLLFGLRMSVVFQFGNSSILLFVLLNINLHLIIPNNSICHRSVCNGYCLTWVSCFCLISLDDWLFFIFIIISLGHYIWKIMF